MKSTGYNIDSVIHSVFGNLPVKKDTLVVRMGGNSDVAALRLEGGMYAVCNKTLAAAKRSLGMLAVHNCCNELAASGARPVAVTLSLSVPGNYSESDVRYVFMQVAKAAEQLHVDVAGVQAEVSTNVRNILLTCCAYGRVNGKMLVSAGGAQPGDSLILTKTAALEGSIIICNDFTSKAYPILTHEGASKILEHSTEVSAVRDGMVSAKAGVNAMFHVSKGGVLEAVYRMCMASGCGADVKEASVPLLEGTRKLCRYLVLDPLRLSSSGCMLISTADDTNVLRALKNAGIAASVVGRILKPAEGINVTGTDDIRRGILPPQPDELLKLVNNNTA